MTNPTRQFAVIEKALEQARSYFAIRASIQDRPGDIPNEEMLLHDEIEQAQIALNKLREPEVITMREFR